MFTPCSPGPWGHLARSRSARRRGRSRRAVAACAGGWSRWPCAAASSHASSCSNRPRGGSHLPWKASTRGRRQPVRERARPKSARARGSTGCGAGQSVPWARQDRELRPRGRNEAARFLRRSRAVPASRCQEPPGSCRHHDRQEPGGSCRSDRLWRGRLPGRNRRNGRRFLPAGQAVPANRPPGSCPTAGQEPPRSGGSCAGAGQQPPHHSWVLMHHPCADAS